MKTGTTPPLCVSVTLRSADRGVCRDVRSIHHVNPPPAIRNKQLRSNRSFTQLPESSKTKLQTIRCTNEPSRFSPPVTRTNMLTKLSNSTRQPLSFKSTVLDSRTISQLLRSKTQASNQPTDRRHAETTALRWRFPRTACGRTSRTSTASISREEI